GAEHLMARIHGFFSRRIIVVSRPGGVAAAARRSARSIGKVDLQDSRPWRGKQGARPDAAMGSAMGNATAPGVNYRGVESMGYSWPIVNFLRSPAAAPHTRLVVSIPPTQ